MSDASSQRGIVAVLALAGLSASFLYTIVIPLQPDLPRLLDSTAADAAWVITATLLAAAVGTPISGRLGDIYGKRIVCVVLLVLAAVGGVLGAVTSELPVLIVARVLQGLSTGVVPLGISILRDLLPAGSVPPAVALISATLGGGGALGFPTSALVVEHLDWHVLFLISAVAAGAPALLLLRFLPPDILRTRGRVDIAGLVGLIVGLVLLLVAVSRGNEWGWTDVRTVGCLLAAAVTLAAWGVLELRIASPLVDLRVSARRPVLLTNVASIAMGFALFVAYVAFPQLLQLPVAAGVGMGVPLLPASLVLAPSGVAILLMSPIAGVWQRRIGPKPLLIAGAGVIVAFYVAALFFHSSVWQVLILNTGVGIGIGLSYAAMPALIMRAVPAHETGAANGLNALMRSIGTSAAAAVVGSVLARAASNAGSTRERYTQAFSTVFWFGIAAALMAVILAALIPSSHIEGSAISSEVIPGPSRPDPPHSNPS